jgi:riboflavin kinase/FMN adenylyltransferase
MSPNKQGKYFMVRLKGIKNILFDFGGVLVDLKPQACLDAFAALGIPQVSEYLTPYGHKGPFGKIENGDISLEQFREELRGIFKVQLKDEQIDEAWAAFLLHIPLNKMKMVHELAKKYRVFLLSNTNPIHIRKLQEFEQNGFPLKECFEKLYLSYQIGLSKPGKEIYEYVLRDGGMSAEETLLVDDGPANCKMAVELGMQAYQPKPYEDFSDELLRPEECVATMGFFDGVHRGHKFLIDETKRIAGEKGLPSMVISFWPHPRMVLHSDFYPQLLTTKEEKEQLIKDCGVDYVRTLNFDVKLAELSARDFMKSILKDEFNVSCLVIGYDHRFGNMRSDGFDEYVKYGKDIGIVVIKSGPFYSEDISTNAINATSEKTKVSSSLIRRLLLSGCISEANNLLGYQYKIKGTVVGGQMIGRTIGFPTANIRLSDLGKLIPGSGVYAVWVYVDGKHYKGMMNIGRRPTLHIESDLSIEVHLLGFSGNLYEKELEICFVQRFRKEQQFPDIEALVAQLYKDQEYVENFLKD